MTTLGDARRGSRRLIRGVALSLLAVVSACDLTRAFHAPLPDGAHRFTPPPIYADWWALTEACSGHAGSFAAIRWYVVPNATKVGTADGRTAAAYWDSHDRIVLAGAWQWDGEVVRHEMLHALRPGEGHSRAAFVRDCGGVVSCEQSCLVDAGPSPAAPVVPFGNPSTLDIRVAVVPAQPSVGQNDGRFSVVVSARNRSPHAVRIDLSPKSDFEPSVSFGYRFIDDGATSGGDARVRAPEDGWFAAGETKRFAFDFRVVLEGTNTDVLHIRPGTYAVAGSYGGAWAPTPLPLTISR